MEGLADLRGQSDLPFCPEYCSRHNRPTFLLSESLTAMTGMSDTETKSYLTHHLALAGRSDTLFSDDAIALIHQVGRGIPRAVNNLAVQALVAAFATGKAVVDESSARAAVTEVTTE